MAETLVVTLINPGPFTETKPSGACSVFLRAWGGGGHDGGNYAYRNAVPADGISEFNGVVGAGGSIVAYSYSPTAGGISWVGTGDHYTMAGGGSASNNGAQNTVWTGEGGYVGGRGYGALGGAGSAGPRGPGYNSSGNSGGGANGGFTPAGSSFGTNNEQGGSGGAYAGSTNYSGGAPGGGYAHGDNYGTSYGGRGQVQIIYVFPDAQTPTSPGTSTWDNVKKSYEFVLTNSNLTAAHNRGYSSDASVYGSQGISSGDHSFKLTVEAVVGPIFMGVANKTRGMQASMGWSANDAVITSTGSVQFQSSSAGSLGAITAGSTYEIRIKNLRLYARKDGGLWNGRSDHHPDLDNGINISAIPTTAGSEKLFPVLWAGQPGTRVTANFTDWGRTAATPAHTGTGAATLPAIQSSASAGMGARGAISASMIAPTGASQGRSSQRSTAVANLVKPSLSTTAVERLKGTATALSISSVPSGAGVMISTAVGVAIAAMASAAATGSSRIEGNANQTLINPSAAGEGDGVQPSHTGSGEARLEGAVGLALGRAIFNGNGWAASPNPTASGSGSSKTGLVGFANVSTALPTAIGAGHHRIGGDGFVTTQAPIARLDGNTGIGATSHSVLPALSAVGASRAGHSGNSSLFLQGPTAAAIGSSTDKVSIQPTADRTWKALAESRAANALAEARQLSSATEHRAATASPEPRHLAGKSETRNLAAEAEIRLAS